MVSATHSRLARITVFGGALIAVVFLLTHLPEPAPTPRLAVPEYESPRRALPEVVLSDEQRKWLDAVEQSPRIDLPPFCTTNNLTLEAYNLLWAGLLSVCRDGGEVVMRQGIQSCEGHGGFQYHLCRDRKLFVVADTRLDRFGPQGVYVYELRNPRLGYEDRLAPCPCGSGRRILECPCGKHSVPFVEAIPGSKVRQGMSIKADYVPLTLGTPAHE